MVSAAPPVAEARLEPKLPVFPRLLVGCALLVAQIIAGIYRGLDRTPPDLLSVLGTFLLALAIVAWFQSYCRAFRISQPIDMGWFLMVAWPVVVPYYLISREGRRGLRRIGTFVLAWLASAFVGVASGLLFLFFRGTE